MEFKSKYYGGHLCQCLSRLSTQRGDSVVTIFGDQRKTGVKFVEDVLSLARGLVDLGIRQGDVVAISAFNSDMYLEWLLAVAFVGGISAPLNYRWSFEEAGKAMKVAKPVMLVADNNCQSWYSNLQDTHLSSIKWFVSLVSHPSNFKKRLKVLTPEMLKKYSMKPLLFNYTWAPEGAAIICFTSGTTGEPKGATISHGALIVQSLAKLSVVGYSEDDVYLHTAPLCHIGGLSSAIAMLMVGGCHILIPKFEPKATLEAIEQHRVTSLIAVPAMMADLIDFVRKKEICKRETVNKILNGGGALSTELIKDTALFFPKAKLLSAYGMTETCSSLTFISLHDPTDKISSSPFLMVPRKISAVSHQPQGICVGKPAPHVELKICGDEFSTDVGRILTRGPHVMLRYWGAIPTTPPDSSNEDWLDTGDIGSIDKQGNLWLIGRNNGRIKSGGENIYPEEVETILKQHPGVASVVVVGVPETRLTEMVVACIQLEENWEWSQLSASYAEQRQLSREYLRNYCKENDLSGFKIPKEFVVRSKPFPLTTSGKIRRDQIRTEVIVQLQDLKSNL